MHMEAYLKSDVDSRETVTSLVHQWSEAGFLKGKPYSTENWLRAIVDELNKHTVPNAVVPRLAALLNHDSVTRRIRLVLLNEVLRSLTSNHNDSDLSYYCTQLVLICEAIFLGDLELVFVAKSKPTCYDCFKAGSVIPHGWRSGDLLEAEDFADMKPYSLLLRAAKAGLQAFVSKAVEYVEKLTNRDAGFFVWQENSLAHLLSLSYVSGITMVDLAVDGAHEDIVRLLLSKSPGLKERGIQRVVAYETTDKSPTILELFLSSPPLDLRHALRWTIIGSNPDIPKVSKTIDIDMARRINSVSGGIFDASHAASILKSGSWSEWWEAFKQDVAQLADKHDLLVLAIQLCREDAVAFLLTCQPSLLVPADNGRLPLLHNVPRNDETEEQSTIRPRILKLAVRTILSELHAQIPRLREILTYCGVPVKEICLDLSGFPVEAKSFEKYASRLNQESPQEFETTLAYVKLPDLDTYHKRLNIPASKRFEPQPGIKYILEWLRNKGVETIVRLDIQDDWETPYEEEFISRWARIFHVEVLNWRRKDMSVTNLAEGPGLPSLCKLHLYGSGLNISLAQWSRPESFAGLHKLKEIVFHSAEGRISGGRENRLRQQIQRIVTDNNPPAVNGNVPQPVGPKFSLEPSETPSWSQATTKPGPLTPTEATTPTVPHLEAFAKSYEGLRWEERGEYRTKVAIIDNGVEGVTPRAGSALACALQRGKHVSYVSGQEGERPWWLAEEPHGTWMANLITAIDPRCDLYIARVCTGKVDDIDFSSVTKAIEWATQQKVDVISMSFALYQVPNRALAVAKHLEHNLNEAVRQANYNGIVMMCSTSDTGRNIRETWPVKLEGTIGIAGCDYLGNLLPNASIDHAKWYLPGSNVDVGQVPLLTAETRISGSSPATAIAAGLASLTLSCYAYNQTVDLQTAGRKKEVVQQRFRKMTSGETDKYVQLALFCGANEFTENDDLEALIVREFSSI